MGLAGPRRGARSWAGTHGDEGRTMFVAHGKARSLAPVPHLREPGVSSPRGYVPAGHPGRDDRTRCPAAPRHGSAPGTTPARPPGPRTRLHPRGEESDAHRVPLAAWGRPHADGAAAGGPAQALREQVAGEDPLDRVVTVGVKGGADGVEVRGLVAQPHAQGIERPSDTTKRTYSLQSISVLTDPKAFHSVAYLRLAPCGAVARSTARRPATSTSVPSTNRTGVGSRVTTAVTLRP